MKTAKYLVLCSRKDGIGGSALHFTSQLKVKSIKQLFSMFIKVRHTPKSDFEIKFYVGKKGKIQPYSVFGDKQQTSADFKLINDCTPRKFFNKQRMETTLRNIAKRDKYFVKRNDWWRPPKVVYKKRHYRLCKTRRFTAEQLAPLAKTFGKEGAYLYRDAIPRIVAEFLRKKWFPTPNLESRVYAFKHLFWDFYEAVLLVTKMASESVTSTPLSSASLIVLLSTKTHNKTLGSL